MFTYTAKLTDGRLVCLVTQQSDGTYAVASALPHADRNQAARNGFYALQAVSRGWIRKFSPQTLAYIDELLPPPYTGTAESDPDGRMEHNTSDKYWA